MSGVTSRLTLPRTLLRAERGEDRIPSASSGRGSPFLSPLRQFFPGPGSERRFFFGCFSSGGAGDDTGMDVGVVSSVAVEACRSRSGGPWWDAEAVDGCSQSYVLRCCAGMDVSFNSLSLAPPSLSRLIFCFFAGGERSGLGLSSSEDEYPAASLVCLTPSFRRMGGGGDWDCESALDSPSSVSRCCMPGRSWRQCDPRYVQ